MLDRDTLDVLLDLHRRSYALLRWMNVRMKAGTLRMDALHGALDEARARLEAFAQLSSRSGVPSRGREAARSARSK